VADAPPPRSEDLAEVGDVDLDALRGGRRRALRPEFVDQPVDRDRPPAVEEEQRKQSALFGGADRQRFPALQYLERPKKPKLRALPSSVGRTLARPLPGEKGPP
jgi:hypothetical protein